MKKIILVIYSLLICKGSFANKYSELQVDPSVLGGASGSDDYVFAIMFPFIVIGAIVVAQLFKSNFYTPVKRSNNIHNNKFLVDVFLDGK